VVVNKGINKAIDSGIKYMSNPEVEEVAETVAESGAEGGKLKTKRKPSQRNLLIGQLMKKGYSMKEANQIIKQKMKK
jgi:SOS response regulatory protein OraA/RecX